VKSCSFIALLLKQPILHIKGCQLQETLTLVTENWVHSIDHSHGETLALLGRV